MRFNPPSRPASRMVPEFLWHSLIFINWINNPDFRDGWKKEKICFSFLTVHIFPRVWYSVLPVLEYFLTEKWIHSKANLKTFRVILPTEEDFLNPKCSGSLRSGNVCCDRRLASKKKFPQMAMNTTSLCTYGDGEQEEGQGRGSKPCMLPMESNNLDCYDWLNRQQTMSLPKRLWISDWLWELSMKLLWEVVDTLEGTNMSFIVEGVGKSQEYVRTRKTSCLTCCHYRNGHGVDFMRLGRTSGMEIASKWRSSFAMHLVKLAETIGDYYSRIFRTLATEEKTGKIHWI